MKIYETFIVWHDEMDQYVKMYHTTGENGMPDKYFIEADSKLTEVYWHTAMDLLSAVKP